MRYQLLFSISLVAGFIQLNLAVGQTPCKACLNELDTMTSRAQKMADEIVMLKEDIFKLSEENGRLSTLIREYNQEGNNTEYAEGFGSGEASQLRDSVQNLIRDARVKSNEITKLKEDVDQLKVQLVRNEKDIDQLRLQLASERWLVEKYRSSLDSIEADAERERQKRLFAESMLDEATRQYNILLPKLVRKKGDVELQKEFKEKVWAVYDQYDQYKGCLELKNCAAILTNNHGNIIDELGTSQAQRLNQRSGQLLEHLGRLLEQPSCAYEHRSDLDAIISRLPSLILIERNEVVRSGERGIRLISTLYQNGEYAAAMNLYDKFEPILDSEGFQTDAVKPLILEAKLAIGAIMLWDLGDISLQRSLFVPGSWLADVYSNRSITERKAIEFLHEVIESDKLSDDVRYEASIIEAKYFK